MPSYSQEQSFVSTICPRGMLDDAISWIKDNLAPDEVFDQKTLEDWAQTWSSPADTFTDDQLKEWAEDNGYAKVLV